MARVFIPQVPSRFDREFRMWVPTVNIDPAGSFGEIEVLLPPEAGRLHLSALLDSLRQRMEGYTKDDYVVALGDPSIMIITACLALRKTGGLLRLLKWDRQSARYTLTELSI